MEPNPPNTSPDIGDLLEKPSEPKRLTQNPLKDQPKSRESELTEPNDDLRPEYDLSQLQVRRLGPGRQQFGDTFVRLAPDVAAVFQNADAVNEALRLLIKIAQSSSQPQQAV